jgi:hypothetical protein
MKYFELLPFRVELSPALISEAAPTLPPPGAGTPPQGES